MTPIERFSQAADALFDNLGVPALFISSGKASIPITVVARRPEEIIGDISVTCEITLFDIRVKEVIAPKAEDIVEYEGTCYKVIGEPRQDLHQLIWKIEATRI